MKAIQIKKNGDASVLEYLDLPQPTPGPGEALIQIKMAGLNFIDIYIRSGRYPRPLPHTPGMEGSGVVTAIGEGVTEVKVGDRVAYTGALGSYAQYQVVNAAQLIPLPDDISFEQGAAFPLQGMTAHYLLHDFYKVQKSDRVLVHAAAGGVGLLLVQWLNHWGVTVIGTVSTAEKAKVAQQAGAKHTILYTSEDFVEETMKLTQNKGADYIIDGVGKTTFAKDLEAVRYRGHVCLFGSSSGPADPLLPNALQAKSLSLYGGSLFNFIKTRDELLWRANDVFKGMKEGWLNLRIEEVFPLAQAAKAQTLLEGRKTMGKVLLSME